ncbi:gluconate 2-dehydrogenase subunit 3 family protein [Aquimarina sp. D1M17]|uniref:gluconate 2-dehydrogenase subunit 3 family protein n=1 Tax=Aquimarina acroporae TaxID=2937283 RepID=UPI0020BF60E1|nr:gluconate 2-dehydrogenase subunit 3 family protein [Aquimarina acroporae]MCK8523464.1 gluconate 2-dehydrogenase subunit 3 family protein [Aquimarina acroporae]
MKRREAIRNIGITAGALAVTPTMLSILQSCTREIQLTWTPELLSEDEAKVLDQLVDLIIPETENIPGAKALNVPMFVDRFVNNASKEEEAYMFKKIAGMFNDNLGISEENPVKKIKTETYDALLAKYLKSSKEQQEAYEEEMEQLTGPEDLDKVSKDALFFTYLSWIRGLSIWGFKTSEEIGKNVLAYLPVPGEQVGCDSLENLTQGRDWSL